MNNPAVDRYFQDISKKFEISADNVRRIAFGEDTGLKHSIISSVLIEFVRHSTTSDGLIFAMVWQGEHVDNVVTNLQDYDWTAQVMEGLNLRLHRTPYRTQMIFANSIFADYAYFEYLLEKRPGAAFIILQPDDISEIQAVCNQKDLPLVLLAPPAKVDLSLHYTIRVDDKSAMKNTVEYIFKLGHRRIAFITGNQKHYAGVERLAGYYEGLKDVGLSLNEDWIFEGNWREDTGYSAAQHFLNTAPQPTAIISSNDQMALGAIKSIQTAGLNVPGNISVVGCNDIATTMREKPALTTVHIPMTHLGKKAGEYAIDLLNGRTPESQHYVVETKLIPRESTAPPPA